MKKINFSNVGKIKAAVKRATKNLIPPPKLSPSDWAEKNIVISIGNATPGPIRFNNAPYQRGMIDVIKEPGVNRVTFMTGAQLGKTTIQQCIAGYFIAHEPRSQIFVQPTQNDVQTFLETKLRPMLEANPSIQKLMAKPRGRDGVNNSRMISYIGGWLMFSWAGSPKTLRGRSAPVTQADEIDGFEVTAEGDAVQLLAQRSATFGDQRLLIEASTPTIKGQSRIESSFEAGDQRRFYVPCPDCGEKQTLKWSNVHWLKDEQGNHLPETASYACECCGSSWDDGMRVAAIRKGEWEATKPFRGHASFHLPELASTFRRMRDIVQSFLDKKNVGDLQSFVNVSLAETWEEQGDQADAVGLMERVAHWPAEVPAGGVYLTAGIDMQQDRLEVETVAWGLGEQSYSVDYAVLWGDPMGADVWADLDDYLSQTFQHETGAQLPISAACLDTGGTSGYTQAAYEYAKGKLGRRLFAIKGAGGWGRPIVTSPSRKKTGKKGRPVDLFSVGVDEAKLIVMRRLNQTEEGPGYCHFPADRDPEYFKQITAEKLVTRYIKGFAVREWHKTRDRNEALDCRVYAYAALKIMNPNIKRISDRLAPVEVEPVKVEQEHTAVKFIRETSPQDEKPELIENDIIEKKARPRKRRRSKNNFVKTW